MKHAVIQLGAGPVQRQVVSSLLAADFVPVLVDRAERPGGFTRGAVHVRASVDAPGEILRALAEPLLERDLSACAVVTSTDLGVRSVPTVAAGLGLPHATLASVRSMDDKERAREILTAAQVRVPKGWVGTAHDRLPAIDPDSEYVVKPTDSSGSRGVLRARGPAAIDHAIAKALHFSERYLIEEYIDGQHLDINGSVVGGEFELVSIGNRRFSAGPACVPLFGAVHDHGDDEIAKRVTATMQRVVTAFDYRHGPIKADAIDSSRGLVVLEAAARFHGDVVSSHAAVAAGRAPALLHWLSRLGFGRASESGEGQGAWFAVFAKCAGTIDRIEGIDAFRECESFEGWIPRLGPGDPVGSPEDNRALVGFGLVNFDSGVDVWQETRRIRERIHVSVC